MRLVCPQCDSRYDVPDGAIPPAGREVQCAVCAHSWYQLPRPGPADAPALGAEPRDTGPGSGGVAPAAPNAAAAEAAAAHGPGQTTSAGQEAQEPAQTRPITGDRPEGAPAGAAASGDAQETPRSDEEFQPGPPEARIAPSILDVLRSEADRELRARRAETGSAPAMPTAPVPPQEPAIGRRDRPAPPQPATRGASAKAAPRSEPVEPAALLRRRVRGAPPTEAERRAQDEPSTQRIYGLPVAVSQKDLAVIAEARHRRGFRLGFGATAGLVAALLALFFAAPALIRAMPATAPVLQPLIEGGEAVQGQLRAALESSAAAIGARLDP